MKFKQAKPFSYEELLMLAVTVTSLIVFILATGTNISSNLMTSLCTNPFATSLAFMLGHFIFRVHFYFENQDL